MHALIQGWLQSHLAKDSLDYVVMMLWGEFAGATWGLLTGKRVLLPHLVREQDGWWGLELGFVSTILVGAFVAAVIDYHPVLAGAGTFLIFAIAGGIGAWWRHRRHLSAVREDGGRSEVLRLRRNNLAEMERRAAMFGRGKEPLDLLAAIDLERHEIARLSSGE